MSTQFGWNIARWAKRVEFSGALRAPGSSIFNFVQSGGNTSAGATSLAATFSNAVAVGDLVVVSTGCYQSSPATVVVSDNYGNVYHNAAHSGLNINTGTPEVLDIWYTVVAASGSSFQVTMTPSASAAVSLAIADFSVTGAPVAVTSASSASGISALASAGSVGVPSTALVVSATAWGNSAGNPSAPGGGFAWIYSTNSTGGGIGFAAEYETGVTSNPATPTFGFGGSTGWGAIAASFTIGGALIGWPPARPVRGLYRYQGKWGRTWRPGGLGPPPPPAILSTVRAPVKRSRGLPPPRGRVWIPGRIAVSGPPLTGVRALSPGRRSPGAAFRGRRAWLPVLPSSPPLTIYHVYANSGIGDPINYRSPIASLTTPGFQTSALSHPGTWSFGVRAFDQGSGLEEQNLDCGVTLILDSSGNDITNQPPPPLAIRAYAKAGGAIQVEWTYPLSTPLSTPTGFHVYIGAGTTPNYTTPAATVPYNRMAANTFVQVISGLGDGVSYSVGVRAYNAVSEESNTNVVSVTAVATGPAAVDLFTGIATE
jgi:hypothetical protein